VVWCAGGQRGRIRHQLGCRKQRRGRSHPYNMWPNNVTTVRHVVVQQTVRYNTSIPPATYARVSVVVSQVVRQRRTLAGNSHLQGKEVVNHKPNSNE